jgi:hypothetical protein
MNTTVKLYSLSYKETKTYLFASVFVAGNVVLPQLCHLLPKRIDRCRKQRYSEV